VENQLNQLSAISDRTKFKAVLLTGEFGENLYLFELLEAKLKKGVKLMRGDG
jgi:MOSC domain-containing protein YiiM